MRLVKAHTHLSWIMPVLISSPLSTENTARALSQGCHSTTSTLSLLSTWSQIQFHQFVTLSKVWLNFQHESSAGFKDRLQGLMFSVPWERWSKETQRYSSWCPCGGILTEKEENPSSKQLSLPNINNSYVDISPRGFKDGERSCRGRTLWRLSKSYFRKHWVKTNMFWTA